MTGEIVKYFGGGCELDGLSVTDIERLMALAPSSSLYTLLLAKKMNTIEGQNAILGSSDRVMYHYMLENDGKIPSITDLQEPSIEENLNGLSPNDEMNDLPSDEVLLDPVSEDVVIMTSENTIEDSISNLVETNDDEAVLIYPQEEDPSLSTTIKKKKGNKKFKLQEYSGISDFSKWLLAFKKDDLDKLIRKEEKAAKKRLLEENAKKSVTKSSTIISESLAEILANQGHLDDAKKMYEQLMQKYPEKSSYFALKLNLLIKT